MFGLFGKKLDPAEFDERLQSARIAPHYQDGNFAAFMIFVEVDASILTKHLANASSVNRMLQIVETRIREEQDYEDDETDMVALYRESNNWEPNLLAPRMLAGTPPMPPVCSWEISISSDGTDRIELKRYPR